MHDGGHYALSCCQSGSVALWRLCTLWRDISAKLRRGEERYPWLLVRILTLRAAQVFSASPLFSVASACWMEHAWGSQPAMAGEWLFHLSGWVLRCVGVGWGGGGALGRLRYTNCWRAGWHTLTLVLMGKSSWKLNCFLGAQGPDLPLVPLK